MPANNMEHPKAIACIDPTERQIDALQEVLPGNYFDAYDMKKILSMIVDHGDFTEVHKEFAPNIVVGFARFGGMSVGLVANQPACMAGILDSNASVKAARFIRFCDCFNIPLVTLVDVPGFMPGSAQEYAGVIRHGGKLLYAYAEATVPKITIVIRKNYGGAYCVMAPKHLRGDINYAWPSAQIAVMGSKAAVEILYGKEAQSSSDPSAYLDQKEKEYAEAFLNPYCAAERGYVDEIIAPAQTRFKIIKSLLMLKNKKDSNPPKKHGNIPL